MNLVYATELTHNQWQVLETLLPAAKSTVALEASV